MIIKVYEKVKEILKKEYKFFITLFLILFVFSLEFPYYINKPGGLINLENRIIVKDGYESKGTLNLAYVSELKATLPTLIISLFNDNWDVVKKEEVISENENIDELYFRNRLLLDEANDNAIILGFTKAFKNVTITSTKVFVTYIDVLSNTDLKIGDQILKIDNVEINNKQQLNKVISEKRENDIINISVLRDNKILEKKATIMAYNGKTKIGIMVSEKKEYQLEKNVTLNFSKSEFGPSGGLMTSLAVYNYLIEEDITHGKAIVGTGTIDLNGDVGSIGGIEYKLKGAVKKNADIFLVPSGKNYEDAINLKKKYDYDIEIVPVSNFDDAIKYLKTK